MLKPGYIKLVCKVTPCAFAIPLDAAQVLQLLKRCSSDVQIERMEHAAMAAPKTAKSRTSTSPGLASQFCQLRGNTARQHPEVSPLFVG